MWTGVSLWVMHVAAVAIYAVVAWRLIAAGTPWPRFVIALPLAYAALILAITLLEFLLSWLLRARRAPEHRIGPIRTLWMITQEFVTLLASPTRMMLYRWRMRDPAPTPSSLPIVLVHGVLCNAGVWMPMARKLAAAGLGPVYALSYGPPLNAINEFVTQLDRRIDAALAATGATRVVIVAHSMGGLIARAYLHAFGGARVARLVMIGTPHHGSVYAFFCPGACIAQMRPGNPWLAALPPAGDDPPLVSLWSPHDSMVVPQTSSVLADATNVAFPGIGHNALLRDNAIFERVADEIRVAQADQSRGPTRRSDDANFA